MTEDFIKIIGIVVIIGFLIFLATKSLKLHMSVMEGLTNPTDASAKTGVGASANGYASSLKNKVTQMQNDVLLMTNKDYKKDYENIVLYMDDYVNALMLKTVLSINVNADNASDNIENIKTLNELNSAKASLNNVMKYIDSH
ncbi:MAG: hypothetical protein EBY20_01095 [Alphaproteobacteria bacterium]|uniref:Uncharacterized protein n=1 Tax=viral metagenome TaxID=1070528 RepID=A0A6C0HPF7_9ZZZZ|nr:hypothetical protein [Alphaproteobacteria bacterium]